ncbi:amino acid/polyamine/organocation transporter, APC superfamily [Sulfobacillus thermosulfidooxidans DSM 9293]|uniref:Amino acid/polyamine/organocation transporter, APC superfamily n=1 Tax=Sulfobacillus thermosulfidooxidans (strain DSM 9293 / VKM B-1269 / AT-1) TaxID=929705 RepID=A0A1W1WG34_SULTA|nr:APC family permease [Sulfobacillus thermosulfidooxidans]SMC05152.1 amino acid/polyamine/organocation transporter, APC superfamily [Sulfobacillus thermosulfidooxidans DSM 9293]
MKNLSSSRFRQVFHLTDLTSLSISSVGPLFSIAAAGGVMIELAGSDVMWAILIIAIPLLASAFIFRLLNQHFPNAGASYHWGRQVMGARYARFQAIVVIVAYFSSLPPIVMPAAQYTWALFFPNQNAPVLALFMISAFWVTFAMIPLLMGSKPTARFTELFLGIEVFSLVILMITALWRFPLLHVKVFAEPHIPWTGIFIAAVVASTIMDGWEIDSYAAEEAKAPTKDPGLSGILGALFAFGTYAILFPLILHETPLRLISNSPDPLSAWAFRIFPSAHWIILIPILASTAGSLWLTTYILSRVLFALGRDRLLPQHFTQMNTRKSPYLAIILPLSLALLIVSLELWVPSLDHLFQVVLSSAGFFLTLEFFLDSLSASWFLTKIHRHQWPHAGDHQHLPLRILSYLTSSLLFGLLGLFLVLAPGLMGSSIDWIVGGIVLFAGFFALQHRGTQPFYVFDPADFIEVESPDK